MKILNFSICHVSLLHRVLSNTERSGGTSWKECRGTRTIL